MITITTFMFMTPLSLAASFVISMLFYKRNAQGMRNLRTMFNALENGTVDMLTVRNVTTRIWGIVKAGLLSSVLTGVVSCLVGWPFLAPSLFALFTTWFFPATIFPLDYCVHKITMFWFTLKASIMGDVVREVHQAVDSVAARYVEDAQKGYGNVKRIVQTINNIAYVGVALRWGSFAAIVGSVYIYLRTMWRGKPRKEAMINKLYSGEIGHLFDVLKAGMLVGALVTGLIDLGLSLSPKDMGLVSVVTQVFTALSTAFKYKPTNKVTPVNEARAGLGKFKSAGIFDPNAPSSSNWEPSVTTSGKKKILKESAIGTTYFDTRPHESSCMGSDWCDCFDDAPNSSDYDTLDEDDDPAEVLGRLRETKSELKKIWDENKETIAWAAFAVIVGVALFLVIHHPDALRAWMYRRTGLKTFAPKFEAKGKTKGRARTRKGDKRVGAKGIHKSSINVKSQYIIYDDDNIVELMKDGEFKTIGDYVGSSLPKGHYIITRQVGTNQRGNPIFEEEEFEVESDDDSDSYSGSRSIYEAVYSHKIIYAEDTQEPALFVEEDENGDETYWAVPKEFGPMTATSVMAPLANQPKIIQAIPTVGAGITMINDYEAGKAFVCKYCKKEIPGDNDAHIAHLKVCGKKEALVAHSPRTDTSRVSQFCGTLLREDDTPISQALSVKFVGKQMLLMNKHSLAEKPKWIAANGKKFELPAHKDGKVKIMPFKSFKHSDLVAIEPPDGLSYAGKKHFEIPDTGSKVTMYNANIKQNAEGVWLPSPKISQGTVVQNKMVGEDANVQVGLSTLPGDCGAPYINANGAIVGIHFQAGDDAKSNWGIAVSPAFLEEFSGASGSKN